MRDLVAAQRDRKAVKNDRRCKERRQRGAEQEGKSGRATREISAPQVPEREERADEGGG
jgi:hypothetical protein